MVSISIPDFIKLKKSITMYNYNMRCASTYRITEYKGSKVLELDADSWRLVFSFGKAKAICFMEHFTEIEKFWLDILHNRPGRTQAEYIEIPFRDQVITLDKTRCYQIYENRKAIQYFIDGKSLDPVRVYETRCNSEFAVMAREVENRFSEEFEISEHISYTDKTPEGGYLLMKFRSDRKFIEELPELQAFMDSISVEMPQLVKEYEKRKAASDKKFKEVMLAYKKQKALEDASYERIQSIYKKMEAQHA